MSWGLVSALGSSIRSGDSGLQTVPGLLLKTIQEGAWRDFTTPRGELVHHEHIDDFITTPPTQGLGASVELVERLISGHAEVRDALDKARQGKHGGDRKSATIKIDNIQLDPPTGTSANSALRRLRKDRPDLHARVLADELSPHAAAVEAGFRPRSITIRVTTPESIARTLRKQLTPDVLDALIAELRGGK